MSRLLPTLSRLLPCRALMAIALAVACAPLAPMAGDKTPGVGLPATQAAALLSEVLGRTDRIAAFHFESPCFECRVADLTVKDILEKIKPQLLPEQQSAAIRNLLSDPGRF